MPNQGKSDRGFASMDEDKQREIASKGGRSVPDEKRSFSKDRQMAAEAGREGGGQSGGQQGGHQQGGQGGQRGGQEQAEEGTRSGQQRGGESNFANDRERASQAGKKGGRS